MRRTVIMLLVLLCAAPSCVFAAGSACTGTNNGFAEMTIGHGQKSVYVPTDAAWITRGDILELEYAWTSDSETGAVTNLGGIAGISGMIVGYKAVPDGTATPTDDYDATIVDAAGLAVVQISNLGETATDTANRGVPMAIDGNGYAIVRDETLGLTIANAGNSKAGTIYIYVVPR